MAAVEQFELSVEVPAARTPRQLALARLRRDYVALASLAFIGLLVAFAAAAPAFVAWTGHALNTSNSTGVDDYTLLPVGPLAGCPAGLASVGERACFVLGAWSVIVEVESAANCASRSGPGGIALISLTLASNASSHHVP